jgi:ATPase family AAA domain-containing protein 3A/B
VKNPKQVATFIGYICLLTSAIFVAREMSRLIRQIIESCIGKPQLIRETTRKTLLWSLLSWLFQLISYLNPWRSVMASTSIEEHFDDLILPKELKDRVIELAYSARNARRHNAPFRHGKFVHRVLKSFQNWQLKALLFISVLLYGPPGTGETESCFTLA